MRDVPWPRIVAALVVGIFVLLVVSNSIRTEIHNARVQQHIVDGTTCILGSIQGQEGIERPSPERTDDACTRYLGR